MARWMALSYAACALVACGCGSDDITSGPCVHTYKDALFHIASVADSASLTPIDTIFILEARRDTIAFPPSSLVLEFSDGIAVHGDTIECDVPCAFGTIEGSWEFRVSAAGYQPQWRSIDARYSVFVGGCPSYNDSGMRITWSLSP